MSRTRMVRHAVCTASLSCAKARVTASRFVVPIMVPSWWGVKRTGIPYHALGVGVPRAPGRERPLPEDGAALDHGWRKLAPLKRLPVRAYPTPLVHEQRLAAVRRGVDYLSHPEVRLLVLPAECFYLLRGERLEDVHQREEPEVIFRGVAHLLLEIHQSRRASVPNL